MEEADSNEISDIVDVLWNDKKAKEKAKKEKPNNKNDDDLLDSVIDELF